MKEGYAAEVTARQNAEALAAKLKAELLVYQKASIFGLKESMNMSRDDVASLSQTKAALDQLCKELRTHRDDLVVEINNAAAR